ncbi:MAG: response regulator transcription factor [Candidatus Wallbacteria bacterium]|nr:response regulator transcription factor [Candidatus Wallbacteria bacterium]
MSNTSESKPAPRILIVDDDGDVLEVMSKVLELNGYKPIRATDGKQGLEALRTQKIDLILLDLMMPVMDGFETLDMIQKQSGMKGVPVIVLSARGEKDSVVKALKQGAVDYVHKGTDPDELLARVHVHLTIQQWRQKAMHEYGELIKKEMQEKYRIF